MAGTLVIAPVTRLWRRSTAAGLEGVVLIGLAATAIRFVRLDFQSLWLDEAYTIYYAMSQSWGDIWHNFVEPGENGPLYTLAMRVWISLGWASGFWIRAFSAIFGSLATAASYYFYRQFLNRRVSLLATGFFALAPASIWYSQEGRQYSLVVFLSICALTLCARLVQRPSLFLAAANASVLIVALLTHLFAIWLVLMELGLIALADPSNRKTRLLWIGSVLAPGVLFLIQNVGRLGPSGSFGYPDPGLPGLVATTLFVLIANGRLAPELALAGFALLVTAALTLVKQPAFALDITLPRARVPWFFIYAVLAPILAYFAFSQIVAPVAFPRYFLVVTPALFGLLAFGNAALYEKSRWVGLIAGALLGMLFVMIVIQGFFTLGKPDFRSAVSHIVAGSEGQPTVLVRPGVMIHPVNYYAGSLSPGSRFQFLSAKGSPSDEVVKKLRLAGRFWIVDAPEVDAPMPDDLGDIALAVGGQVTDRWESFGVRVVGVNVIP